MSMMMKSLRIAAMLGALGAGAACTAVKDPGPTAPPSIPATSQSPAPSQSPSPSRNPACGGFAAMKCPDGQACTDDPSDDCDPAKGGRDCGGVCAPQADAPPAGGPACGGAPDPTKRYVGKSADECARIRFVCEPGTGYFSDDCGCGCQTGAASGR